MSIDEVEACLSSHPAVQAAAAALTESPTGMARSMQPDLKAVCWTLNRHAIMLSGMVAALRSIA